MAIKGVGLPSLQVLKSGGVVCGQVGTLWNIRALCSPRLGSVTRSPQSLSCSSFVLADFKPVRLVSPSRTNVVCSAVQTDVSAGESDVTQGLEKLKGLIDLEGGDSKSADDQELLRFLRANSFSTETAAKSFAMHQNWRSVFVPNGYFVETELAGELEAKKSFWISEDKKGRPALLTIARNHFFNKTDFDEFKRFIVYALDMVIRGAPPDEEQFFCIVDLKGLGLKNLDSKSFIASFEILQNHYPQRLDKVFMINVPLIFSGVWKVVKPFLDEDTRNRIIFVNKNKLLETLTKDIDIAFLPKEYGGLADLVLLQDAKIPNWPPTS